MTDHATTVIMSGMEGYFGAEAATDQVMREGKSSLSQDHYKELKKYYFRFYEDHSEADFESFLETLAFAQSGDAEAVISAVYTKEALLFNDYDLYQRKADAAMTAMIATYSALPASGLKMSGGSVRFSAPRPVPKGNGNFLEKPTAGDNVGSSLRLNGSGRGLTGDNWKFDPAKDLDLRGSGKTYKDALDEAFNRTGLSRDQFTIVKWGKDANGKSVPVEWSGPNGASVNMDIPEWNNVKPNGTLGEGPHQPHIGYQTPGKSANRTRGHIFVDDVPATRR